jgi:hypothetical protein
MTGTLKTWGLFLVTLAPSAHAAPEWCAKLGGDKPDLKRLEGTNAVDALAELLAFECTPGEGDKAPFEAAKTRWVAQLHMKTDADWADAATWLAKGASNYQDLGSIVSFDNKLAWSTLNPLGQFGGLTQGFRSIKGYGPENSWDYAYPADALGPHLTELGRAGLIQSCMREEIPAAWAICQPDIDLLDVEKAWADLAASAGPGDQRTKVRLRLSQLPEALAEHAKKVKAARASDPAYEKMFELAKAPRAEFDALWKSNPGLVDLALTMDDARMTSSRKLMEGCTEKTAAAWKAAVAKMPAKGFEGFDEKGFEQQAVVHIMSTPEGAIAAAAGYTCARVTNASAMTLPWTEVGSVMEYTPTLRGPRLAADLAIRSANLQLDDASAHIGLPSATRSCWFDGKIGAAAMPGVVAGLTPVGKDKVKVTFKHETAKQDNCVSAKSLNRISYIRNDGSVVYQSVCLKWETVTLDVTREPDEVAKEYAVGVKPGMKAHVGSGVVSAAWNKGKKAPVVVFGVLLK